MCEEVLSNKVGKLQRWGWEWIWKSLRTVLEILATQISVSGLVLQWGVPGTPFNIVDFFFFSWQSNKVPVVQHPHHVHPLTPLITYSNEHFTPGNPPPHLPADVDPKTGRWEIVWGFFFWMWWVDLSIFLLGGRSVYRRISHAGAPKGACKMSKACKNPGKIVSFLSQLGTYWVNFHEASAGWHQSCMCGVVCQGCVFVSMIPHLVVRSTECLFCMHDPENKHVHSVICTYKITAAILKVVGHDWFQNESLVVPQVPLCLCQEFSHFSPIVSNLHPLELLKFSSTLATRFPSVSLPNSQFSLEGPSLEYRALHKALAKCIGVTE